MTDGRYDALAVGVSRKQRTATTLHLGPQDMSMYLGLIGQPDAPRVQEMDPRVRTAVEAKGKRYLGSDLIVADRASHFFPRRHQRLPR